MLRGRREICRGIRPVAYEPQNTLGKFRGSWWGEGPQALVASMTLEVLDKTVEVLGGADRGRLSKLVFKELIPHAVLVANACAHGYFPHSFVKILGTAPYPDLSRLPPAPNPNTRESSEPQLHVWSSRRH